MVLSFILPIYNGEKYLIECINSLLNQNINRIDYEIICIDDCSKDNSVSLIKEYQKTNSNIRLIENTQNIKTGSVCNIGLDNAQGNYIWIIGQDDWIQVDSISKLAFIIAGDKPDVIAFNYRRVDFDENELHSAKVFDDTGIIKGEDYIRSKFGNTFPYYLLGYEWRAIFSREFLIRKKIRFPDGAIYEDTTFLFKAILYAERFKSISDFLYYYRVNSQSITDVNKKYKGDLVFEFAFKAGNEVLDLANEIRETHPDFSTVLIEMAKWYFNGFVPKLIGASFTQKKCFYNELLANNLLVKKSRKHLQLLPKIIIIKHVGILIAILLKPAYLLKKKMFKRNGNVQEWCY